MVEAARRLSTEAEVDHLVAVVGAGETVEGEIDAVVDAEDRLRHVELVADAQHELRRADGVDGEDELLAPDDEVGHVEADEARRDSEQRDGELEPHLTLAKHQLEVAHRVAVDEFAEDEQVEDGDDDARRRRDQQPVRQLHHEDGAAVVGVAHAVAAVGGRRRVGQHVDGGVVVGGGGRQRVGAAEDRLVEADERAGRHHRRDDATGERLRADDASLQRPTHGDVALHREDDDQPDGDEAQRVGREEEGVAHTLVVDD